MKISRNSPQLTRQQITAKLIAILHDDHGLIQKEARSLAAGMMRADMTAVIKMILHNKKEPIT